MAHALDVSTKSRVLLPADYAPSSPSGSLQTGNDLDSDSRAGSVSGSPHYWRETQAAATNDSTAQLRGNFIFGLTPYGMLGRYFVLARLAAAGTGHLGVYKDGSLLGSSVSFTNTTWATIDLGADVLHELLHTYTIRAWGDVDVHLGDIYVVQRCQDYAATDLAVAGSPVSDGGSISANVIQVDPSFGTAALAQLTVPADWGRTYPLAIGRCTGAAATVDEPDDAPEYIGENLLNGTGLNQFGSAPGFLGGLFRRTNTLVDFFNGDTRWPYAWSAGGQGPGPFQLPVFSSGDAWELDLAAFGFSASPEGDGLLDRILFSRAPVCAEFDAYNSAGALSFTYTWTVDSYNSGQLDHYDILVLDAAETTLIASYLGVTSGTTVTLPGPGEYHVYLLPTTADGDYSCGDMDDVTVASQGQIIRYR